jgi:hypothetical protein
MSQSTLSLSIAGVFSFLVSLGLQVALLVTVLTVVRRHRPAAVPTLAGSVTINLVSTVLSVIVSYVVTPLVIARGGGMESYALFSAASSVGFGLVHLMAGVLLVVGLVKLATPEERPLGA